MVLGQLSSHLKKKKLDLYFTDYTKTISRWIKEVTLKNETITYHKIKEKIHLFNYKKIMSP